MKSISVQDVGKELLLSGARPRYRSWTDLLRWSAPSAAPPRRFQALDSISFDAESGEVLGIIGRNGAILGMNHREIVGKLDAIVAFAGVESHLDEPVRM
jgi:ABC-type polysaccharide/polyol phosphate transport system ATPase subunit